MNGSWTRVDPLVMSNWLPHIPVQSGIGCLGAVPLLVCSCVCVSVVGVGRVVCCPCPINLGSCCFSSNSWGAGIPSFVERKMLGCPPLH